MTREDRFSQTLRIGLIPGRPGSTATAPEQVAPSAASSLQTAVELAGSTDYQELLQNSPDAALVTDMAGTIISVNERATRYLGYEADEFCSMTVMEIISGADESLIATLKENLESEKFTLIEAHCIRSDGSTFPTEVAVSRLLPDDTHLCFFARDISDRIEAEEISRREQGLLLGLLDTLPDYVYFKDAESRFIRINKSLADYLSLSDPSEAEGKTDHDFFAGDHASVAREDEKRIMETGIPFVAKEEKEVWPDGHETWVSTTKAPLKDRDGNVVGTLGISRDITEFKTQEKSKRDMDLKMQQSDKMESLGMLASGIAHDFNNLLMGILGHASLVLSSLPKDDRLRESVEHIESTTMRAADLTNQLLAYSGRSTVSIEKMDLSGLVKEMTKLLEVTISRNVSLAYGCVDGLPPIKADVTQMRQVIMNLIKNASDAIGEVSGSITVRTGTMECDKAYLAKTYGEEELAVGPYTYVEVTDTGCGMSEEVAAKVCDPFFTTKPTGRGLGMATVLGIIRGHKGFMEVDSKLGEGTTMRVMFPSVAGSAATTPDEKQEDAAEWRGSGTALVVDDEDIIRDVSSEMMRALGFETMCASSGEEALALFREKHEDIVVVLLDEVMSGISGEKVLEEMMKTNPTMKVVLCSGYAEADATGRFVEKGLSGFIQKPFTLETLSREVKAALEG